MNLTSFIIVHNECVMNIAYVMKVMNSVALEMYVSIMKSYL